MANIALFCDGTWNTPDQLDDGVPAPTNVVKLFNLVAELDAGGVPQAKYYHPGVGTDPGLVSRFVGGGLGEGLDQTIKSAYKWLAVTYQPGDRIFAFGFSRGAYTVRSLGGMIAHCGLLDLSSASLTEATRWNRVDSAFDCYRAGAPRLSVGKVAFHNSPAAARAAKTTPIHLVGVWDTVGALGIPAELALLKLIDDPTRHEFHDTALSDVVHNARHAVAIDERRSTFMPTLWTNVEARPTVKQVWFPGVHGDVGGSYARAGLSDGALDWMAREAEGLGLGLRATALARISPDPLDVLHDSLTGLFKALRSLPRSVPELTAAQVAQGGVHGSATARQADPPLAQGPYWRSLVPRPGSPAIVPVFAQQRWNATGIYLKAGTAYSFTAAGEWIDGSIHCGPKGTKDGSFQLAEAAQLAADTLGGLEALYHALARSEAADFWYTKRCEAWPWFALIGVCANGTKATDDNLGLDHEMLLIGDGAKFTPARDGYLYCFANDAWQTYSNNRGSVTLSVGV